MEYRNDIQTLRAIAVVAVLAFHLWPTRITGGYVGVDVFFVISGYLIVSRLIQEIDTTGTIRLLRFWSRRARRLLPAALLVLAVTAVAVLALVPVNLWAQYLREIIGSTLYIQNWILAADSTDYMAQHNTASPVQHFWSLSVEEQFYIVVPLLLLAVAALVRRRHALLVAIAVLTIAGLVVSVWYTAQNPPAAYFNTGTRVWEFGVGAVLGFLPSVRSGWVLWCVGGAMIAVAAFTFTGDTPFPSWTALLPVLGAALMIMGGRTLGALRPIVENRAAIFIGAISYSVYLWHWPLIVLLPSALGRELGPIDRLVVLAVTFVVAWACTRWIENPIRESPRLLGGARRPITITAWSAAGMAAVVGIAAGGIVALQERRADAIPETPVEAPCFGAAATIDDGCDPLEYEDIVPDPAFAVDDDPNRAECWSSGTASDFNLCTLGPADAAIRLAAFGDSKNNALLPVFDALAERNGWRIDVAGHTGCYWTAAVQMKPTTELLDACEEWKRGLRAHLETTGYDAILVTNQRVTTVPIGDDPEAAEVEGLIEEWAASGVPIIAIRDTPRLADDVTTCVTRHLDAANVECARDPADAFGREALLIAAERHGADVVDFTEVFCGTGRCVPVIGGVMAYRDADHITGTFAATLTPIVEEQLRRILFA